ncbi:MAG: hypothetical protein WBG46_01675 [Nonlabens sp.]
MITVYNKEDLHRHLEELRPEGYVMNKYGQYLKRDEDNNSTVILSFGMSEHFPFGVNFSGFAIDVIFHEVEDIIHSVYNNHTGLEWYHERDNSTYGKSFAHDVLGRDFILGYVYGVLVEDDASFARVRPHLQTMQDAGLDFLRQHESLRDFYDFAQDLASQENALFYGNKASVKRLVVRKLLNIPYDTLHTRYLSKNQALNRSEEVAFLQDLKTHLDNL